MKRDLDLANAADSLSDNLATNIPPDARGLTLAVWQAIDAVNDPEIPVLSVVDLGMVNRVQVDASGCVQVNITPTFTACPALDVIKTQIARAAQLVPNVHSVEVVVSFDRPWNSDRISERGREAIRRFGLAPPVVHNGDITTACITEINCPKCGSKETSFNMLFGSTLCRSSHYCYNCREAFEAFKPI